MHITQTARSKRLIELSKYGGLVAIFLEWFAVVYFHLRTSQGLESNRPISYYSTLPETRLVFSLCFGLASASFWIFVIGHLRSRLTTPTRLFSFAALGLLGIALIPYHPENRVSNLVHIGIAYLMTLGFLFGIYSLARRNKDKTLRKNSLMFVALGAGLAASMGVLPHSITWIVMQILLGVLIQIWIIYITFYTPHGL